MFMEYFSEIFTILTTFIMEHFFKIFTVLITCISACIAYQQWKTNKYKLKSDLYNRRLAVYLSTYEFLCLMFSHAYSIKDKTEKQKVPECTSADLDKFHQSISVAKFLFDGDITEYLEEIYTKGCYLVYEDRTNTEYIEPKKHGWLVEQLTPMQEKFEKYLDLSKL